MSESSGGATGGDGGSRGTGGGDGGGSAGTTPRCIRCEKDLPGPCNFCPFCAEPQDTRVQEVLSDVPRCFQCKVNLFTPKQNVCHKCGIHNPNQLTTSQHLAGGEPPPHVQPQEQQPQLPALPPPSPAPIAPLAADPHQRLCPPGDFATHYDGVKQAVHAHRAPNLEGQNQGGGDQPGGVSGAGAQVQGQGGSSLSPTERYILQGSPGGGQQNPTPPLQPDAGTLTGSPHQLTPSANVPRPQGPRVFGVLPRQSFPSGHSQLVCHDTGAGRGQYPLGSRLVTGQESIHSTTDTAAPSQVPLHKEPSESQNANLKQPSPSSGTPPPPPSRPSATTSQADKVETSSSDLSSETQKTQSQISLSESEKLGRKALHPSSRSQNGADQSTTSASEFSISVGSTASPEHGTLVDKTGNDSTTSVSTGQGEAQNDRSGLPADPRKRKRSRDESGSERTTEPEHAKLPKTEGTSGVQDPLSTALDHPPQDDSSSPQKAGGSSEPQKDGPSKKPEPQPQNPPSSPESPRVPGNPPCYADATKGQVCLYFHPAVLNYLETLWVHEYCILGTGYTYVP